MVNTLLKNLLFAAPLALAACKSGNTSHTANASASTADSTSTAAQPAGQPVDISKINKAKAAEVYARPQVPIICYHAIRDWRSTDSQSSKDFIIPVNTFKAHIKMLADSGYHTISPDQLYAYLNTGAALPSKPVMLTFDDGLETHYTQALPILKQYGFKGAFYIMTVSTGRPHYLSSEQIKAIDAAGHTIGLHTYDHQNVKKYQGDDWVKQIDKPKKKLEETIGKPVVHFAYPFGLWNQEACVQLEKHGMKDALILGTKRDANYPLYTIRRIIGSGFWSAKTLSNNIKQSF